MKMLLAAYAIFQSALMLLLGCAPAEAKVAGTLVGAKGRDVDISISMDSIADISGCDEISCQYWQMVFEKQEEFNGVMYHRYYSSDVFPASQLRAEHVFHLPAGEYSNFTLEGYATNKTGDCGQEDYSPICPDSKHIMAGERGGMAFISDPSFMTFIFSVAESDPLKETIDVIDDGVSSVEDKIAQADKELEEAGQGAPSPSPSPLESPSPSTSPSPEASPDVSPSPEASAAPEEGASATTTEPTVDIIDDGVSSTGESPSPEEPSPMPSPSPSPETAAMPDLGGISGAEAGPVSVTTTSSTIDVIAY
jgi:hypothetical protein